VNGFTTFEASTSGILCPLFVLLSFASHGTLCSEIPSDFRTPQQMDKGLCNLDDGIDVLSNLCDAILFGY
jgi:hypothetical protein